MKVKKKNLEPSPSVGKCFADASMNLLIDILSSFICHYICQEVAKHKTVSSLALKYSSPLVNTCYLTPQSPKLQGIDTATVPVLHFIDLHFDLSCILIINISNKKLSILVCHLANMLQHDQSQPFTILFMIGIRSKLSGGSPFAIGDKGHRSGHVVPDVIPHIDQHTMNLVGMKYMNDVRD